MKEGPVISEENLKLLKEEEENEEFMDEFKSDTEKQKEVLREIAIKIQNKDEEIPKEEKILPRFDSQKKTPPTTPKISPTPKKKSNILSKIFGNK